MNLPPFHYGALMSPFKEQAKHFIDDFNQTLERELARNGSKQYRTANIMLLDVYAFWENMAQKIAADGVYHHPGTQIYIRYPRASAWDFENNVIANNPNEYVFWDGLHPTASVHQLLAIEAEALLAQQGIIPVN